MSRPLNFIERVDLAYDCLDDITRQLEELERQAPAELNRNIIQALTSVKNLIAREEHINARQTGNGHDPQSKGTGGATTAQDRAGDTNGKHIQPKPNTENI
jgi:hypothetical protein